MHGKALLAAGGDLGLGEADRIDAGSSQSLSASNPDQPQVAHFKLRDAEGNVIGVAAQHIVAYGESMETSWLLTFPSRGTIVMAADFPRDQTIHQLLADRGLTPGRRLEQDLSIDFGGRSRSIATSGEFEGINFELVETWVVSGLDENGEIRGTLSLNTVGEAAI